jgi:hypothetical protein
MNQRGERIEAQALRGGPATSAGRGKVDRGQKNNDALHWGMINPDRFSEPRRSQGKPRPGLHPVTKLSADLLRCPPCHIVELMAFTDALGKFAVVGFTVAGTVRTAWERLPAEAQNYILTRAVAFGCSEVIRDLVR